MSLDINNFWDEEASKGSQGEPLTKKDVEEAEKALGYKIPSTYVKICEKINGGVPKKTLTPKDLANIDHIFPITEIVNEQENWIGEWEYPKIGIYFADTDSGGHDLLALDYRKCGPKGEPSVVHIDQELDYKITPMAKNLEEFLLKLRDSDELGEGGEDDEEGDDEEGDEGEGDDDNHVYLECMEGNSFKFYDIVIDGNEVTTKYGKIGTDGVSNTKDFKNEDAARKFFDKTLQEKMKKGYEKVTVSQKSGGDDDDEEEDEEPKPKKSAPKAAPKAAGKGKKRKADEDEDDDEEEEKAPKKAAKTTKASTPAAKAPAAKAGGGNSAYLEFEEGKSSKFYEIKLTGTSVTSRYGKIGSGGQETTKDFDTAAKAEAFYNKTLNEKKSKGYKEV